MNDHKEGGFALSETELAELAKALSHPARLSIIKLLIKKKECPASEIYELIPLAQPTVSQHLSKLLATGFIQQKDKGVKVRYSVNVGAIPLFNKKLSEFFNITEPSSEKHV